MDIIDKIYILNLDRRIDRMNDMTKLMNELMVYKWERFPAIKPKFNSIDRDLYSGYNRMMKLNKKYVKGSVGCKLSHIEILKLAKKNHYKSILILEDDVEFVGNFRHIDIGMRELEGIRWDILYLGLGRAKYKEIEGKVFLHKVVKGLCTHAYIVNNLSYTKIIKLLENSNKQIDVTYQENFGNYLQCYIIPNQFQQNKSYSDINRLFKF